MGGQVLTVEQRIARLATASKGVVTLGELVGAGVSSDQIEGRVARGSLIRVHRGVYRVGHRAPSTESSYLAAVKACGEGAVLSGLAAAHLYGLTKGEAPVPEVTAPNDRKVDGVLTHWARRGMDGRDCTEWRGIPVTTVPRTLVDIAARRKDDELARAAHEAAVRFGVEPRQVEAVLARWPTSPGAPRLRGILHGDSAVLLSKLERAFIKLLEKEGFPLPKTNRKAGAHWVDCRWPALRLTVELDSYAFHNTRHSWERDREREREARARGDAFHRYTWRDVFDESQAVIEHLRALASAHPEGWQSG